MLSGHCMLHCNQSKNIFSIGNRQGLCFRCDLRAATMLGCMKLCISLKPTAHSCCSILNSSFAVKGRQAVVVHLPSVRMNYPAMACMVSTQSFKKRCCICLAKIPVTNESGLAGLENENTSNLQAMLKHLLEMLSNAMPSQTARLVCMIAVHVFTFLCCLLGKEARTLHG